MSFSVDRLYKTNNTINRVTYWKGMAAEFIKYFLGCDMWWCQKLKSCKCKYGHFSLKNVRTLVPWQTVHANLIGPYSLIAPKEIQPDSR